MTADHEVRIVCDSLLHAPKRPRIALFRYTVADDGVPQWHSVRAGVSESLPVDGYGGTPDTGFPTAVDRDGRGEGRWVHEGRHRTRLVWECPYQFCPARVEMRYENLVRLLDGLMQEGANKASLPALAARL
jgi:hypothetical protein